MNTRMVSSTILLVTSCIILSQQATSFGPTRLSHLIQPNCASIKHHEYKYYRAFNPLSATDGLDEDIEARDSDEVETADNFDGKGLANYLGPYALAFLVSVAVTAGFVKFVLMDY